MGESRDDRHPPTRARDSDVQPAFAVFTVEWSESAIVDAPVTLSADADAEEDDVAFVTLHSLEVLDEESLLRRLVKEGVQVRPRRAHAIELGLNTQRVLDAERDYAQTLLRSFGRVL